MLRYICGYVLCVCVRAVVWNERVMAVALFWWLQTNELQIDAVVSSVCVCVGCSPLPPLLLSALRSVVASLFAQLFTSHSTTQLLNTATPFPACLVLYESVEYELSRLRLEKD